MHLSMLAAGQTFAASHPCFFVGASLCHGDISAGVPRGPSALCFEGGRPCLAVASRGVTACPLAAAASPQGPCYSVALCLVPPSAALAEAAESLPLGSGRARKAAEASGSSARGTEAWFLPHTVITAALVWRRSSLEGQCQSRTAVQPSGGWL